MTRKKKEKKAESLPGGGEERIAEVDRRGKDAPDSEESAPGAEGRESTPEPDRAEDELRRRVEELNDRWLRAVADLDNFRKRTAREREKERVLLKGTLVLPFLDVMDDLERALEGEGGGEGDFRRGVEMIRRKFLAALGGQGVEPFPSLDTPFDPERHEALQTVPDPEREVGIVVAEIRKGYRMGDRVLRPAQVAVAAPANRKEETANRANEEERKDG